VTALDLTETVSNHWFSVREHFMATAYLWSVRNG